MQSLLKLDFKWNSSEEKLCVSQITTDGTNCKRFSLLSCKMRIIIFLAALLAITGKGFEQGDSQLLSSVIENFKTEWCRQRKWRLDWEKLWEPCRDKMLYKKSEQEYVKT